MATGAKQYRRGFKWHIARRDSWRDWRKSKSVTEINNTETFIVVENWYHWVTRKNYIYWIVWLCHLKIVLRSKNRSQEVHFSVFKCTHNLVLQITIPFLKYTVWAKQWYLVHNVMWVRAILTVSVSGSIVENQCMSVVTHLVILNKIMLKIISYTYCLY